MRFYYYAIIILSFCACTKKNAPAPATFTPPAPQAEAQILPGDTVTYLALGDSYTYGLDVPQDGSYPYQLSSLLKQNKYAAAAPVVVASFGWTAGYLLSQIPSINSSQRFSFVTLLIGVNDQVKGTNTELFAAQLDSLISDAIIYTGGYQNRVFVISIPDWSVTPFAADMNKGEIASGIQVFNSINESEAGKFGVNYLDITALSELAATDPLLIASDGLHPSAKMYALWVNQFYGNVVGSFKQ